jgi:hypothetical protein
VCTVSMVGDHYRDKWERQYPWTYPSIPPQIVPYPDQIQKASNPLGSVQPAVTKAEFEALKKDVEEMKELLKRAKKYDEDNGEKDCELAEKYEFIRQVAKFVGVEIEDVIGPKA